MKAIAKKSYVRYLLELDEDDIAELEGTDIACEIQHLDGKTARLWVDEEDIPNLVSAVYGEESAEDFMEMFEALRARMN
jgi:hypothetical protein